MSTCAPWLLLALSAGDPNTVWTEVQKTDGLIVYSHARPGTDVAEMKVVGTIDSPPHAVWKVIRDYDNYAKNQPYTDEGKVLAREGGDKVIFFYSVVNAPLVDRRDYCIRVVDESAWADGKGYLLMTWKETPRCPAPRAGLIRVKATDGYWKLEPREKGAKTMATYVIFTDPAGAIPQWVINQTNKGTVVNIFQSTRRAAAKVAAAADGG